jgi:glycosyltransferase involved in cell wall biosynthesis
LSFSGFVPESRTDPLAALEKIGQTVAMRPDSRPTLCFPLAGDSLGGSHHSLLGLLRGLDPAKYRILVIVERPGARLSHHFADFTQLADPVPPEHAFVAGNPLGVTKFVRTLGGMRARARFLKRLGVDIVHTNDGRSHATWALPAKLAGARLVWHHRADPDARGLRYLAPFVADRIITVSQFSLPRGRLSHIALRKAEVVFSPFNTDVSADRDEMRTRLRRELGLSEDALIVGFFGILIDRKRPLMFIEAIARLRGRTSRPVCGVMFGEAETWDAEEAIRGRIEELQLGRHVVLMGYRAPGADWIAACDILAVPAIGEPLGRTLVEAMLVRTPIVATRSGGNPEAILDGMGTMVPADDPEAMARGCQFVADNTCEVSNMTERARASAKERFTDVRHVESVEQVYRRLLGTRPS